MPIPDLPIICLSTINNECMYLCLSYLDDKDYVHCNGQILKLLGDGQELIPWTQKTKCDPVQLMP